MILCNHLNKFLIKVTILHLLNHIFIQPTIELNFIYIEFYFKFNAMCLNPVLNLSELLLNIISSVIEDVHVFISPGIVASSEHVSGHLVHILFKSLSCVLVRLLWVNFIISINRLCNVIDVNQIDIKCDVQEFTKFFLRLLF